MKKIIKIFLAALLTITANSAFAKTPANLTIFSEPNMTYALVKLNKDYARKSNIVVSTNFNSSFELIQNIDSGEACDIFISSHPDWVEILKQKGVVDVYNLSNIAKDHLVLVASKNNDKINPEALQGKEIAEVLKTVLEMKIPLIVDSEYTSLGRYTKNILSDSNIADNSLIYRKVHEDKKSIIDFINDNDGYLGIILASGIHDADNVKIIAEIPGEIYYQAVVIAGDNMENARDFLKFLKSDKAKSIFAAKGFISEQ